MWVLGINVCLAFQSRLIELWQAGLHKPDNMCGYHFFLYTVVHGNLFQAIHLRKSRWLWSWWYHREKVSYRRENLLKNWMKNWKSWNSKWEQLWIWNWNFSLSTNTIFIHEYMFSCSTQFSMCTMLVWWVLRCENVILRVFLELNVLFWGCQNLE